MPRLRKARSIRKGARIGVALPAGPLDEEFFELGEARWRALGFELLRRPDATSRHGYLAGDDARRTEELVDWVRDLRVEAVLCGRGGYGSHRIVDRLDPQLFRDAGKPLIGYSDVTTLLLWQRRVVGLTGVHASMLERGDATDAASEAALAELLCGAVPAAMHASPLFGGSAEGRVVGGSLNLTTGSLGTPWEVDTRGAILLLEDTNEPPYKVDRMLQQLRAAGKLDACAGIGFGAMVHCKDDRYPTHPVEEVIREIVEPLGVPVLTGLPFGHVDANWPWVVGARAVLDGERGELRFLESGLR